MFKTGDAVEEKTPGNARMASHSRQGRCKVSKTG
jgi:hypothetical protein